MARQPTLHTGLTVNSYYSTGGAALNVLTAFGLQLRGEDWREAGVQFTPAMEVVIAPMSAPGSGPLADL